MANINQIKVNGTTYDMQDSNALPLAGGTMETDACIHFIEDGPINLAIDIRQKDTNPLVQTWLSPQESSFPQVFVKEDLTLGTRKSGSYGDKSFVAGDQCIASGANSQAMGYSTTASGFQAHAEGNSTTATSDATHAEGHSTTASGMCSHAEGFRTLAQGDDSHAEGKHTSAIGVDSHAEGSYTYALGECSHVEGYGEETLEDYGYMVSNPISDSTLYNMFATGAITNVAAGIGDHVEGCRNFNTGNYSHLEGYGHLNFGDYNHFEGYHNKSGDTNAYATGVYGIYVHIEGADNLASGNYAHAEGQSNYATGFSSHAEGTSTVASGPMSHAEGGSTIAAGSYSHAEGYACQANGSYSHAGGMNCNAWKNYSFVHGYSCVAGESSIAIGYQANAAGASLASPISNAIAIGTYCDSAIIGSIAMGYATKGASQYSVAIGYGVTSPASTFGGVGLGKFNDYSKVDTALSVGGGNSDTARRNLFRITTAGSVYALGAYNSSGADYAEFIYPWYDDNVENEDRVGYFVTFKDGKLYKATSSDIILGIISGNPSVIGNSDEDYYWKYERDEFNRLQLADCEEVIVKTDENGNAVYDEDGNLIFEGNGVIIPNGALKYNENYDSSLQSEYIERKNRAEWDYVGMLGILPTRDDGTCVPGGYCKCNDEGIATYASPEEAMTNRFTYIVLERTADNIVKVKL